MAAKSRSKARNNVEVEVEGRTVPPEKNPGKPTDMSDVGPEASPGSVEGLPPELQEVFARFQQALPLVRATVPLLFAGAAPFAREGLVEALTLKLRADVMAATFTSMNGEVSVDFDPEKFAAKANGFADAFVKKFREAA